MNMIKNTIVAGALATTLGLSGAANADTILDTFTSDTLSSEYNLSTVDVFGSGPIVYAADTTTNDNQLTGIGVSGDVGSQVELLRDDVSLDVGETLLVDVDPNSAGRDINGLSIYTTDTPGNRNSSIVVGFLGNTGNVWSWYFNDAGAFTFGNHGAPTGTAESYFIERTATDMFELGYINTDGDAFVVRTVDTTGNTAPGAAIGLHFDLTAGQTVIFDNLRIIPEPASLALLGLGGLMVLRRRR